MPLEELRNCIVAAPFRPFTLKIADGRRIPVFGRAFILIPPEGGRTVIVFQRDGDFDLLDSLLITGDSYETAANSTPQG